MFDRMTMPCRTFLRFVDGIFDAFEQRRYPNVELLRCGLDNFKVYRRLVNHTPFEHDPHHRQLGVVYYDIAKDALSEERIFDGNFVEKVCQRHTRASWNVDARRSGLMAGERYKIEDDFSCPIPDEMLFRAVHILAKRFCLDSAALHPLKLEDVRIPMNSHGGHRFPGNRGENLSKAFRWARKRLSSFMEYGPSPYPCPPYQALSRMQIADTLMPKVRLVWAIATDTLLVCMCIYQMIYSQWQKENTMTCFGYTVNQQNEKVKKLIHSCEEHDLHPYTWTSRVSCG